MKNDNYVRVSQTGKEVSASPNALYVDAGLTPAEFLTLFQLHGTPNHLQSTLQHELRQQLVYFARKGNEEKKAQWVKDMKKVLKERGTLGGLAFLLQRYL